MEKFRLEKAPVSNGLGVERAISQRRSRRDYSGQHMSSAELSHILYYSCGITDESSGLRAAPSAGATYPIEVYPTVNSVDGLTQGIYHYLIESHDLELLRAGDFGREMSRAALDERMLMQANVVLVLAAIFQRTRLRYRDRALRYIHFEAGHIAQNVYLIATSMGLGTCAIGAFSDDALNRLIGFDGREQSVLYLLAVGTV